MRSKGVAVALAGGLGLALGGCVFAVGSDPGGDGKGLQALEKRVEALEKRCATCEGGACSMMMGGEGMPSLEGLAGSMVVVGDKDGKVLRFRIGKGGERDTKVLRFRIGEGGEVEEDEAEEAGEKGEKGEKEKKHKKHEKEEDGEKGEK